MTGADGAAKAVWYWPFFSTAHIVAARIYYSNEEQE